MPAPLYQTTHGGGFQDADFIAQYEKWVHWLWKKVHKGTEVKLLSNVARVEGQTKGSLSTPKYKTCSRRTVHRDDVGGWRLPYYGRGLRAILIISLKFMMHYLRPTCARFSRFYGMKSD
jgi:hypothetical protein